MIEMSKGGPQLCCEAESSDSTDLLNSVVSAVVAWEKAHILCLAQKGGIIRGSIMDVPDVKEAVSEALETENAVSFVDIGILGGCTVDFSPLPEGTIEVLLTAWGSHESTAEDLARSLGTEVFRGN
jgi:hypothetical protein